MDPDEFQTVTETAAYVVGLVIADTLKNKLRTTAVSLNRTDADDARWQDSVYAVIDLLVDHGAKCTINKEASNDECFYIDIVWELPPTNPSLQ